jgi:hypothetical protein
MSGKPFGETAMTATERQRRWRANRKRRAIEEAKAALVDQTPSWFDNSKRRRRADHDRQRMLTPAYVLEPIRELLGGKIGLDPCTEPDNPTAADAFYCPPADGCALPWDSSSVFVNPPYGAVRERWVARCIEEGRRRKVVLLIPAATETAIFQSALMACRCVMFIRSRLTFTQVRPNRRHEAASHGSALFGFGIDLTPIAHLGAALAHAG